MYSPSTFAKEEVKDTSAKVIAEINVTNSFAILLIISLLVIN